MNWKREAFLRALKDRPAPVSYAGFTYLGLGLNMVQVRSEKHHRATKWCLTHLGSGHAIAFIKGEMKTVFPIATELAELIDWTFTGLTGWKQTEPQMPNIVEHWLQAHDGVVERLEIHNSFTRNETLAEQISERKSI